ncbi:MAG: (Fe-S)-binding protein [Desulfomonilaceae bacterium]|nr:(Fe-S)-binding protein [Desulfomonilaceae bacterium]
MSATTNPDTHDLATVISRRTGGEHLVSCLTCGQCVSRCFLNDGYPDMNPRTLIRKVLMGRGQEMVDSEFIWACTLCGRCTTDCPKELQMDVIIRDLRGAALRQGKAPHRIVEGVETGLKMGNNVGMDSEAFLDTVEWLAEEAEEDVEGLEEGDLAVELDREGADLLYIPNPREYTSTPEMFQSYLKFFHYAKADWTMSSKVFDITNWAYYLGDRESASTMVRTMVDEARRLKVKTLVSTECGHGFKILRKDAERWLGEPLGFEVLGVIELADKWLQEGRLSVAPGALDARVTLHDPCNVGRKLGIFEEPRRVLKTIAAEFVEMWPNRKQSICCGGGGSVGQNTDMAKKRLEHARTKRDQILRTGADTLATCCQNCLSQLGDLQSRYEMPLEVKSVIQMLVEAIEA